MERREEDEEDEEEGLKVSWLKGRGGVVMLAREAEAAGVDLAMTGRMEWVLARGVEVGVVQMVMGRELGGSRWIWAVEGVEGVEGERERKRKRSRDGMTSRELPTIPSCYQSA